LMSLIPDNSMITFDIDGEDYLISKTSISEQNDKSYYTAKDVSEMCLFPNEKVNMVFELLNKT